jgi:putative peptidoglycan lipid II flippase
MLRSATVVFAGVLLAKLLGFIEKLAIASVLGVKASADAYFAAVALVWVLFLFFRELLEPSFLPLYVGARARSDPDAQRGLLQLVTIGTAASVGIMVLALIAFPSAFTRTLAPGLKGLAGDQMSAILATSAPGVGFLVLSCVSMLALQGRERFGPTALSEVAFKAALVATVACVGAAGVGVRFLGVGLSIACLLKLGVQSLALRNEFRGCLGGWWVGRNQVAQLCGLGLPVVAGSAIAQLSELAETWFASGVGAGSIAARSYAVKLIEMPILLAPAVWSIVLYPRLAVLWAKGEASEFTNTLGRSIQWVCVALVPLAIWCVFFAEPLVRLVFARGAFDAGAVSLTASAAKVYAIGMPVFAVEALVIPAFFARLDTRTPIIAGILGVGVNLLALWLLAPTFGLAGIAAAPVLSKGLKMAGVAIWIRHRWNMRVGVRPLPQIVAAMPALVVVLVSRECALPHADTVFEVFAVSSVTLLMTAGSFLATWLAICKRERHELRALVSALLGSLRKRGFGLVS